MSNAERKVREAANALHDAIADARAAGLHVVWPRSVHGLPTIAISEGMSQTPAGEPLDLTDEERAAMPELNPKMPDVPKNRIAAKAKARS